MSTRLRAAFVALFALSGFTGLIYESIWTQYLKLFLGHAAYAQTLVLAIFMGGMALGSWTCGRHSRHWKNLLLGYALAEGTIGLLALAFHPVFHHATQLSYTVVIPYLGSPTAITIYKWTLSCLLIFPQTILLGMTFPLMTAGIVRTDPGDPGKTISLLYFVNSLGAALGVLASGFLMIRLVGLPGTIQIAGIMNLGIAMGVGMLAKGLNVPSSPLGSGVSTTAAGANRGYGLFLAASAITGAASFIYEVGWIRMLSLVLGSSTHAFELMLSAFIGGLACGGVWIERRIGRIQDSVRYLFVVQIVMGLCALSSLPLYGGTFSIMQWLMKALPRTDAGYVLFNLSSGAISLFMMFPASFCAGMTLPLITVTLMRMGHGERSIGHVYAANTVGAILGVFFAIHFGMPQLGLKGLLMAGAALDIGLGCALTWYSGAVHRSLRLRTALIVGCTGAVVATGLLVHLDPLKMGSGVYRLGALATPARSQVVYHQDGKTATVSVFLDAAGTSIRTNGKPDASIQMDQSQPPSQDEPTMVLLAALPMSYHPHARTAAAIGFGSGLTTATLLLSDSLESVDTIEIEPAMVEGARSFLPVVERAFSDPRSHIAIDDAKTFFASHNKKYDIIISEPSNPWVSGVAGLFTEEFYGTAARKLNARGVFCQWFHLYEIDLDLVASVLKAIGRSFADYVIYASYNTDIIIIARNGSAVGVPSADVFNDARVAAAMQRIYVNGMSDLAMHHVGGRRVFGDFAESLPIRANSDYHPVLDQEAVRSRFLGRQAKELITVTYQPIPLTKLLCSPWGVEGLTAVTPSPFFDKSEATAKATSLRDHFMSSGLIFSRQSLAGGARNEVERLKRLFNEQCGALPEERISRLNEVIGAEMVPFLQSQEMDQVWEVLDAGPCVTSFTQREKEWITFWKSVGRRNPRMLAQTARSLLEQGQDLPRDRMSVLVAGGMVGHLMQGDRQGATDLWNSYRSRISPTDTPKTLFRILIAMSARR